jgi:hypothetical protein
MRALKSLLLCGLVLIIAGCVGDRGDKVYNAPGAALVRAVHGVVQYYADDLRTNDAKPNMELAEGVTVETGANSAIDIGVNGRTSVVRLMADSKMTLKTMIELGTGDTETVLDLLDGQLLGTVKKISPNSRYEMHTPCGVAGTRGGNFEVQTASTPTLYPNVTFVCLAGELNCVINIPINGAFISATNVLRAGESWSPPDKLGPITPGPLPPDHLQPSPEDAPFFVPPVVTPGTIGGRARP